MDCDDFTCPDGTCVDTKFDCEWEQCGNLTYCQISKMCVTKMLEFCAGCYVDNPYRCNNGQCITKNAFCNDTYECSDRSDETSYECAADNDDDGWNMPWWILQVIGPVIGIGIAILITFYKRKRIARMRAEQARQARSGALVPGAVSTGNMPPPPPGMVMNTVCPMSSTAAPPPSYDSAMRTSKPTNTGFFGGLFTNRQTPRSSAPPTYSSATGGAPYPTNTYPTQPANDSNYNTQYGMQGPNSAFTYS